MEKRQPGSSSSLFWLVVVLIVATATVLTVFAWLFTVSIATDRVDPQQQYNDDSGIPCKLPEPGCVKIQLIFAREEHEPKIPESDDWLETAREVKINRTMTAMNDTYMRANSTCRFKWILLTACGFACCAGVGLRVVSNRSYAEYTQETVEAETVVQREKTLQSCVCFGIGNKQVDISWVFGPNETTPTVLGLVQGMDTTNNVASRNDDARTSASLPQDTRFMKRYSRENTSQNPFNGTSRVAVWEIQAAERSKLTAKPVEMLSLMPTWEDEYVTLQLALFSNPLPADKGELELTLHMLLDSKEDLKNVAEIYDLRNMKLLNYPDKLRIGSHGDIRIELMNKEMWEVINGEPVLEISTQEIWMKRERSHSWILKTTGDVDKAVVYVRDIISAQYSESRDNPVSLNATLPVTSKSASQTTVKHVYNNSQYTFYTSETGSLSIVTGDNPFVQENHYWPHYNQ